MNDDNRKEAELNRAGSITEVLLHGSWWVFLSPTVCRVTPERAIDRGLAQRPCAARRDQEAIAGECNSVCHRAN